MKVYKFGGASVKDASGVKNLASIVRNEKGDLAVVVSAMGKTTNALEEVMNLWFAGEGDHYGKLAGVIRYHLDICEDLFEMNHVLYGVLDESFGSLKRYLSGSVGGSFDYEYDQVVSYGEIWSTLVVNEYLRFSGINAAWIDIRRCLVTDDRHRDANIRWSESLGRIREVFNFSDYPVLVTQGFIGATASGSSATLGREGSDFTAAILANMLDAESVTVWKDVPGLLNADPKWFPEARRLREVSYREAVEMTFSGAKVIHPKTIKPLQNKNIPLYVRSFFNPGEEGTLVTSEPELSEVIPVIIRKENQMLLTLLPRDFSFVMGDHLGMLFGLFRDHKIKVNLVEASAVSINVCVDDERSRIEELIELLRRDYSILYNESVELLTVRHYDASSIGFVTSGHEVLLEQKTRSTVRFVVR